MGARAELPSVVDGIKATLLRFRMPRALDLDRIIRQLERGGVSALERQPFQP
jgi:hypothetical protein